MCWLVGVCGVISFCWLVVDGFVEVGLMLGVGLGLKLIEVVFRWIWCGFGFGVVWK